MYCMDLMPRTKICSFYKMFKIASLCAFLLSVGDIHPLVVTTLLLIFVVLAFDALSIPSNKFDFPPLRAGVLIVILLLRFLQDVLQVIVLLLELRIILQLLLEHFVCSEWRTRYRHALLNSWPGVDFLPPFVQIREGLEVNSGEESPVDPREIGDIRY